MWCLRIHVVRAQLIFKLPTLHAIQSTRLDEEKQQHAMTNFIAEFLGTAVLLTLGNGVVANVVLPQTKGNNGGLIAIAFGWSMAVFVAVFMVADVSGAHLSPAVTIGLAAAGKFPWSEVPTYLLAQLLGAMAGSALVWWVYRPHLNASHDPAVQLAVFCTAPSIRHAKENFVSEMVATFIFILAILKLTKPTASMGSFDALPVALLVLAIGLSLGGPTGYAINPARDLGPRIMHALLPIQGKKGSDWGYAWIPVVAPIVGAILAACASVFF